MAVRVLLVEDDEPTRRLLARAIERQPALELQDAAGDLAAGRARLEGSAPDVLLVDLGLPDGSGIELVSALRSRAPGALAMVITALGDDGTVLAAIEAGAVGYLLKDGSFEEVGEAIGWLLEGGSPTTPSVARALLRRVRRGASRGGGPALSAGETEVLTLVAKGFSAAEIGARRGESARAVRAHVRRIYEEVQAAAGAQSHQK